MTKLKDELELESGNTLGLYEFLSAKVALTGVGGVLLLDPARYEIQRDVWIKLKQEKRIKIRSIINDDNEVAKIEITPIHSQGTIPTQYNEREEIPPVKIIAEL